MAPAAAGVGGNDLEHAYSEKNMSIDLKPHQVLLRAENNSNHL